MTDEPRTGGAADASDEGARDYAELGDRVASVLNAAEEAATSIRAEAESEAESVRREAAESARAAAEDERSRAAEEAARLVSSALSDAQAIRDAARAAASRIAEEGQRRLGELRDDARRLEGRFERAVDDLHDLIAPLDAVVQGAVDRPEGAATRRVGDAPATPVLSVVAQPDTPPEADVDPGTALADDLWPRATGQEDARPAAPRPLDDAPRS